jgi:hypothetical protein
MFLLRESVQDVERLAISKAQKRAALAEAQAALIKRHEKQQRIADMLQKNPTLPRPVEALPPFDHSNHVPVTAKGDAGGDQSAHECPIVRISVLVPNDDEIEEFNGQTLELAELPVSMTVMELKQKLQPTLGTAPSRQKLSSSRLGVLKNSATLAEYQMMDGESLSLSLKIRKK